MKVADSTNATFYKWMNYASNDYDRSVEQDYDHYPLKHNKTYDARIS